MQDGNWQAVGFDGQPITAIKEIENRGLKVNDIP